MWFVADRELKYADANFSCLGQMKTLISLFSDSFSYLIKRFIGEY